MGAPWLLAAAWAWLTLAAFAACLWGRLRHRIPRLISARIGVVAGLALVIAAATAVWGSWAPVGDTAADAAATLVWQSLAVVVAALHIAAASILLGGSIYLACGRLMGTRACAACGWQAMIVERLPEATVATAVTSLGMVMVRAGADRAADGGRAEFPELLGLVAVWLSVLFSRSAWMVRQPAIARTTVAWGTLLLMASIGRLWCLRVMEGDVKAAAWLAGCSCGVALAVLAAALHRQALFLGLRFDSPAALAEIVGGLSPLRRLSACALGGMVLAAACGFRLVLLCRDSAAGSTTGLLIVAVALLWLLVTWGAAILRDRLGPACSPSIGAATVALVAGLGAIWTRAGSGGLPGVPATGVVVFLASGVLAALGIGWCAVAVGRDRRGAG